MPRATTMNGGVIGREASFLATRLGTWQRIDQARLSARTADDLSFTYQAREDIELLGRTLAEVLFLHEPRDGSRVCPGCSTARNRRAWPCPTWELASRELTGRAS
jgi:hypothetical protein